MTSDVPRRSHRLLLASLVAAAVILVLSPPERTLGTSIRWVYLHVALTWSGMLALVLGGLVGLASAAGAGERLRRAAQVLLAVGLLFYGAGFLTSMGAAYHIWGGWPLGEPRTLASLRILCAGGAALLLVPWGRGRRLAGLLPFLVAVYLVWATSSATRVLHPTDPIGTSESTAIRFTFLALFVCTSLAAGAIVWRVLRGSRAGPAK